MDVLVALLEEERSVPGVGEDPEEAAVDRLVLLVGEKPDVGEHADVGDRPLHVVLEEAAVGVGDRVVPQRRRGVLLEPPSPECHRGPPPPAFTRPPRAAPRRAGGAGGR